MASSQSEMEPSEDIESLKERLQEQEENCRRAAEIGKSLLEENIELKSKIDDFVKQYSNKVEALEQENYSLTLKVEGSKKEKEWFDEELSQLRSDLSSQKSKLLEEFEMTKQQELSQFKKQINELKGDYEISQKIEIQLKDKVQQLEDLLQQQLDQTQVTSRSFSTSGDEIADLQQEILRLQADNTGLTSQMIDTHTELKCCQDEVQAFKSKLMVKDEEIQEIQCSMTSYCNSIEKFKTENADLTAQLEALRMEANLQNSKGNSIFSEVEDRRVEAEKRLISLRVKNDTLKDKLELEKQLHQRLKMQMVMLLQMSTGQNDTGSISRLQSQLTEARTTIQDLLEKIDKYENSENFHGINLTEIQKNVKEEDKQYVQYLITMLESTEAEVKEVKQNLRQKNLQLLDTSNQVLTQERSIADLTQKHEGLNRQNMKLALKIEELQLKYEPDKVQNKKEILQKRKEKIPLEVDTREIESKITEKVDPNLGANLFFSKENIPDTPKLQNMLKMSYKKSVSISNDVQVFSENGQMENKVVSDTIMDISKIEVKAKEKPKKELKVKHVKVESSDVNECKNQ